MKLVIQRVTRASVTVADREVARMGPGMVILVGVARGDTDQDARYLARKASPLRIFDDAEGKLNCALDRVQGGFLVVSQFTLYGDCRKGNRPSYVEAAAPPEGRRLFEAFVAELRAQGHDVQTGLFGEPMHVELVNQGPVTLLLESRGRVE